MKDRPITFAVHKKPPAICECEHELHEHSDVTGECSHLMEKVGLRSWACDCMQFRRKGALRKGTRRSIAKHAKAAERKAADYVDGFRIPSTGKASQPDAVALGPDGGELLAVEVKHRRITKARKDAMRQAMHAARGRRGAPIPCLIEIDKPGPGKQDGMDLVSFLAEDWRRIKERLGGQG